MGNTITNRGKSRNSSSYTPSIFNKSSLQRHKKSEKSHYELRSKTLPARNRNVLNGGVANDLNESTAKTFKPQLQSTPSTPPPPNGETSRVLFLLYLIHRTWNVITDTKSKSSHGKISKKSSNRDSFYETESNFSISMTELYGARSQCCSQRSICSCSSCYNDTTVDQNVYNSIDEQFSQDSISDKIECDIESLLSTQAPYFLRRGFFQQSHNPSAVYCELFVVYKPDK